MYCAHCGTKNQDGLEGCDRCGELLERMNPAHVTHLGIKSCPDCKTVNAPRTRFCSDCGRNVDDVIATSGAMRRPLPGRPAVPMGARRAPQAAPPSVTTGEVGASRGAEDLRADAGTPTIAPNDSGTPEAELPESIKGWNWGALFLPFIWGPFNRVWISLVVPIVLFVPYMPWALALLVYGPGAMYVGMRGNELAWRARKWKSVEHFKMVQGLWAKWGTIGFVVFVASVVLIISSGAG